MRIFFCLIIMLSKFSIGQEINNRYKTINWLGESTPILYKHQPLWVKSIVPLVFSGTAFFLNNETTKTNLQAKILAPFNGYHTALDDYIQYIPIAEMYAFDMLKFKARNSIWNQTKYLAISEVVTAGIVHLLKNALKVQRPNNGSYTAFPSGHTSQAFVTSQMLYNEYYQSQPLIGLSGFLFSGATGALRVINNRHWVPDVLLGAGIAMLVTNVVYHFEPLKNWNPLVNKSTSQVYFKPSISPNFKGFNLTLNLQ